MMKKLSITIIACLLAVCSYSQEHIKFNGATFGKPLNEFIKGFSNFNFILWTFKAF